MAKRIEKVAVIGSGIMGGGIAALCASAGIPTVLLDIVPFDLKDEEKDDPKARNRIVNAGLEAQKKAKPAAFMNKKADSALIELGNLTDDFDKLKDCDLIVEVIIEDLKIKQDLFARIEKIRKPSAIISSNTSGLPLKNMAEGRSQEFKEHFLITHFFNPVRYMKLLELVPGEDTKQEVLDLVASFGEKILGKGIVWGKDTPNFIGNRIGVQLICKAFKQLEETGLPTNQLDKVFGAPMGLPNTGIFALADMVGLDTIGHLSENSYELLVNDELRDIYQLPDYIKQMLEKKMFGKKSKEAGGFYKTEIDMKTWKKIRKRLDPKSFDWVEYDRKETPDVAKEAKKAATLAEKQRIILYGDNEYSKYGWNLISSCLIYAANRIPEISDTIVEIDNAMKWGYAWEAGPFEIWDNIGVKEAIEKMKADGLTVPDNVLKMVDAGNETFYRVKDGKRQYFDFASNDYKDVIVSENIIFLANLKADNKVVKENSSASLIDLGDGIFNMEFHTKMNAINGEIVDFIPEVKDYVDANGLGLVIGNQAPGMPGAFCAGGDLAYMGDLAKAGKWDDIDAFVRRAQHALMIMRYSFFPTIAAPYGMTLGGGCEVCLATDKIVAHADLYMGLVEIGAGLLPAGGGCTNTWRKFTDSVPDPVKVSNWGDFFIPAFYNLAMAKVSMSAAEARNNGFLGPKDRIIFNKDYLIGEAKKEALKMVDDGYVPPAKKNIPVLGQEAQGMVHAEIQNMRVGGFITPHMEHIAKTIAYVMSGGEARSDMEVSEDYLLQLEREAFVDLWKTENTQKMANHILTTGKPLMI